MPKLIIDKDNKKGFANKQDIIGTNFSKTETTEYTNTNNKLLSTEKDNKDNNNYSKKEENSLNENIKEILYDQDIMDKEEEEKIYQKLKKEIFLLITN